MTSSNYHLRKLYSDYTYWKREQQFSQYVNSIEEFNLWKDAKKEYDRRISKRNWIIGSSIALLICIALMLLSIVVVTVENNRAEEKRRVFQVHCDGLAPDAWDIKRGYCNNWTGKDYLSKNTVNN